MGSGRLRRLPIGTPPRAGYVMGSTWLWDRVLGALGSGDFEQTATAAVAKAGCLLTIVLDAALVPPPAGHDVHSPTLPRDVFHFSFSKGELRFLDADMPADLLKSFGKPETLPALAARIAALPQPDWMWVDRIVARCHVIVRCPGERPAVTIRRAGHQGIRYVRLPAWRAMRTVRGRQR